MSATISIVVPVYDADPAALDRALGGIAAQTTPVHELIVVDDGSREPVQRDRLVSELRGVPTQLHVLRQENAGAGPARNAGARLATGEYLVFLDADDAFRPSWMEGFLTSIQDHKPLLVSCAVAVHLTTRDNKTRSFSVEPNSKGPAYLGLRACLLPGAYAIRRDVFEELLGGFDTKCTYGEHHELGLRLAFLVSQHPYATMVIDQVLLDRHTTRTDEVVRSYAAARLESSLYVLDKHRDAIARDRKMQASYLAVAGVAAAQLRRHSLARSLLIRSAATAPSPKRVARVVAAFAAPMVRSWR